MDEKRNIVNRLMMNLFIYLLLSFFFMFEDINKIFSIV